MNLIRVLTISVAMITNVMASSDNGDNIGDLATEQRNSKFVTIESQTIKDITAGLVEEMVVAAQAVKNASLQIAQAVEGVLPSLEKGGRLVYSGAGTSGRLGTLDKAELFPTFGYLDEQTVSLMAGGDDGLKRSIFGAEDDVDQAERDFNQYKFNENDVFVLIAASGRTPYPLKVMELAQNVGAKTIGISSVEKSLLLAGVDYPIFTNTGPEAITGSTRMKAGTAQTGVLKTLSTTLMAKMGYVYKGQMVCLQVRCKKLEDRIVRITQFYTGIEDFEEAKKVLESAGGDNRIVVLMHEHNKTRKEAEEILKQAGGNILKAKEIAESTGDAI